MTDIAFTAPHAQASKTGIEMLSRGANAVDAMIAAAAMVAVQYPHMNSLGGDGFWLIQKKGELPVAIDACGYAGERASIDYFNALSGASIPERGPAAAFSVAGTVSGWEVARQYIAESSTLTVLSELFAPAVKSAYDGIVVTESMHEALKKCSGVFSSLEAFKSIYMPQGKVLSAGDIVKNSSLAKLFTDLSVEGLDSFYRGNIAETLVRELGEAGSILTHKDFRDYRAQIVEPLHVDTQKGRFYNLGAPTQGIASLLIVAIFDQLYRPDMDEATAIHLLVEATKQAFLIRDKEVADPKCLRSDWSELLSRSHVQRLANKISTQSAASWPNDSALGDTIWMGAVDRHGTAVSFIQSVYWEFGSGLVLPSYGLLWNNRGVSFSMDKSDINCLAPRKKPRHTLNPALANLANGSRLIYGTMGGEGQPQTQAAMILRYLYQNCSMVDAVERPRWLLGRTWGDTSTNLKVESSLFNLLEDRFLSLGHKIECVRDCNEMMGHAGAIAVDKTGVIADATSDPRSDGAAFIEKYMGAAN